GLVLAPAAVGPLLAGHGGHGAEEGFVPDFGGGLESGQRDPTFWPFTPAPISRSCSLSCSDSRCSWERLLPCAMPGRLPQLRHPWQTRQRASPHSYVPARIG